jgi:hypothetical protein
LTTVGGVKCASTVEKCATNANAALNQDPGLALFTTLLLGNAGFVMVLHFENVRRAAKLKCGDTEVGYRALRHGPPSLMIAPREMRGLGEP